jgi:hypothetical protein
LQGILALDLRKYPERFDQFLLPARKGALQLGSSVEDPFSPERN